MKTSFMRLSSNSSHVGTNQNARKSSAYLIIFFCSMLMLQSRQDVEKAVELVTEALEIDKKCDFAYETLATLEVQR